MSDNRTWRGRVFVGVSLDGYIARADSDLDWLTDPPSDVPHEEITTSQKALEWDTFYPDVDHLLMGRGTYDKVLTFGEWPYDGKTVIVLSSTLASTDSRITVAETLDAARAILDRDASNVYIDGGQVIQACLAADLVDEITVSLAPVLIGGGIPLFGELSRDIRLRLRGSHTFGGMVAATYDVQR